MDFGWGCPRPRQESSQHSPRHPSWNKENLHIREGKGRRGKERQGREGKRKEGKGWYL